MIKILYTGLLALLLHFNAQAQLWESLPLRFDYPPDVMYYDSVEQVSYIGGRFTKVNDTVCNLVKWDGTAYTLMPPSPLYRTYCAARYHGKIYFGGIGLATWDGNTWVNIDNNQNTGISDLYVHNDKLYAVGSFTTIAQQPIGKVAVWNDTIWTDLYRLDTLLGNSWIISSMAFYKGRYYVAGNFNLLSDSSINEITMFDGQRWVNVGGFRGDGLADIHRLLVWKDTLFVSGNFLASSGAPGNGIAKWDGENWHPLNKGLLQGHPSITDLMVYEDELYTTGRFNIMDGILLGDHFRGLAKWDGGKWCYMGAHANNAMLSFGRWKEDIFILGGFTVINGDSAQYIAKWVGGDYVDTCSEPPVLGIDNPSGTATAFNIFPNPTAVGRFTLSFARPLKEPVVVHIHDLTGRLLSKKTVRLREQEIRLPGHTAPGIYLLTIQQGGMMANRKLVVR